jgi:hypothetical protein
MGAASSRRDLHFDLSHLGDGHLTGNYALRAGRRSYNLHRHTQETLRSRWRPDEVPRRRGPGASSAAGRPPTHFAEAVETDPDMVQLLRVYGPPAQNGLATLASVAIGTSDGTTTYGVDDVAQALAFLNPTVTVLTMATAGAVLDHIAATDALPLLTMAIKDAGSGWCAPQQVTDESGDPILAPDGKPYFTYKLASNVVNSTAPISGQAKTAIYSDTNLKGVRWNLLPGVSHLDLSPPAAAAEGIGRRHGVAASNGSGYSISLQDGGPNFGVSVQVNGLSDDFVLDLTVTNSYVRHLSVFASFLEADGKTPMTVPNDYWKTLTSGSTGKIVSEWLDLASSRGLELILLGDADNTIKWCGNVNPESTFLGIPVSSTSGELTFGLPSGGEYGPVGKIRLLAGSLGVNSHNDCDPAAAWLGLSMTALLDLAIPTFGLVIGVGSESAQLVYEIFDDASFLFDTCSSIYLVAEDIFTDSSSFDGDLSSAITALANGLISRVLTKPEVAAKLAGYFGAEVAEDAIPFLGMALQALAIEATVVQLAQTVGEVIASPRVVEFDLTVTMNAQITLVPDTSTGGEFPMTTASFTVTAQYSGNTTRTYTGTIADPKVPSILITWDQIPVGGTVTFVVALFDQNGWGVGKGTSATMPNLINAKDSIGHGILAASVSVQQHLYPLGPGTTYQHSQLLAYAEQGGAGPGYVWQPTSQAPTETASSLGTGPSGHVLQALAGITLSDDLGVLGYSWEASGLNIPPVDGGGDPQTELFTMQNIGFKPVQGNSSPFWSQAGYMTAPAAYSKAPLLLYLRTAEGTGAGPGCFFLDPSGDTAGGFQLRQVSPVTEAAVGMDDPSRHFNLQTGASWGRFPQLPTSMAIHSNGTVVATNSLFDMMMILQLPAQSTPDTKAPWAFLPVGPGTGPGRLSGPALVAIAPNQTILVLEAGNQRIQAFSLGGHPVPAFAACEPPYWIPLVQHAAPGTSVVYLSMSVDVAGYVYVLSQNGNGYDASDFNLDIYTPVGGHLVYQQGLVASGMAVDLWRNLYTLNFQQIAGPGGRTEPSLSEYIPSTPKPSA